MTEVECRAEKASVFGQKSFVQLSARHDSVALTRFFPQRKRRTVGFCFGDRDFMTASPGVYAILCSCKGTQAESAYAESAQESTLRGLRREVRFIMSPPGKRRHNELNAAPPTETPRGTGKPGAAATEMLCTAEKVSVFGAKTCLLSEPRGTIPLWLPLKWKAYCRISFS